jgi:Peptidase inhibitor family I36
MTLCNLQSGLTKGGFAAMTILTAVGCGSSPAPAQETVASREAVSDAVCDPPTGMGGMTDYAECSEALWDKMPIFCRKDDDPAACENEVLAQCAATLYTARCNFLPDLAKAGADATVQAAIGWLSKNPRLKPTWQGFLFSWLTNFLAKLYPWNGPTRDVDPAVLEYFRSYPSRMRSWASDFDQMRDLAGRTGQIAADQLRLDAADDEQRINEQLAAASKTIEQLIPAFQFNSGGDLGFYITEVYPDSYVPVPVGETSACMVGYDCAGKREMHVRHSIPGTSVFVDDVSTCFYNQAGLMLGCPHGTTPNPNPASQAPATLFDGASFQGDSFTAASSVPWVGDGWNDRVSSILVPAGRQVTLYDDINYGGASLVLDAPGVVNLSDYDWNDRTSSLTIR